MRSNRRWRSPLQSVMIILAMSGGYAVAQDITGHIHRHTSPSPPAEIVRQLGLSGDQANRVRSVLEHQQAARQQFFAQRKADYGQLKQWLTPEQLHQLRQLEHPNWRDRDHSPSHPWHDQAPQDAS